MTKWSAEGRRGFHLYSVAMTVLVLCLVVLLNMAVQALADHEGWYFYTKEQYSHEANGLPTDYFGNVGDRRVNVIFCMEEDELSKEVANNLVWQTARQMADRYTFIDIKNVNIYLNPEEVEPYRLPSNANGAQTEPQAITRESVIFASGDRHIVLSMSDFFFLDETRYIESYNGEETMASALTYVLNEERPIAAFTTGHGEQLSAAYAVMLSYVGYDVRTVDLTKEELDPKTELLVCMNPLYDFEKAAENSGLRTEMERVEEFLSRKGQFQLFRDPYVGKLPRLDALLRAWGLQVEASVLSAATANAVSPDGYTFMPDFADNAFASRVFSKVKSATDARLIAKDAGVITKVDIPTGAPSTVVYSLLTAGANATPYELGEAVADGGEYMFAALSVRDQAEGGSVLLVNGVYLTAKDVLQSDNRANRDFFYALLAETAGKQTPLGATTMVFESTLLEGLTMAKANRYTRILVLWVPLAVSLTGAVVLLRRRRR